MTLFQLLSIPYINLLYLSILTLHVQIQSLQFEIQDILLKRTQQLQSEAKCCKVDLKQSTKNEIPYLK